MLDIPNPDGPMDFQWNIQEMQLLDYYGEKEWFAVDISAKEQADAKQLILSRIRKHLVASMSIETDSIEIAHQMGYTYNDGKNGIEPPPRRTTVSVKEGVPHADFKKRQAAGEIMVSNYERAEIECISYPGVETSSISKSSGYFGTKSLIDAGVLQTREIGGVIRTVFGNFVIQIPYYSDGNDFKYERIATSYSEWVFGSSITASTVLTHLRAHKPEYEFLVTSVLAKANRSCVDVLTAFAELPKSVQSLLRGFKSVVGILKDAKKGQFNVTKAYASRDKKRTLQYQQRMKRLDRELNNSNLSDMRRRKLQAHKNRTYIGHREYLTRSAEELSTALSDVWLNYRYNIMPNVYLAQDIYDATQKFERQWITARGTENSNFSIPISHDMHLNVDGKMKITIKRSFSKPFANSGGTVISNDLFVTAWELVPLSLVYDWFINIGDVLSSRVYNITWDQEGSTLAFKYNLDATVTPPTDKTYLIEPRLVVRGSYYKREVINPVDYCGFVWKPKLGLERQIDALALIWKPVRSLLQQGRNR